MSINLILIAAVLFMLAWVFRCFLEDKQDRDGAWHSYAPESYRVRRWHNGRWEYRDMTGEEAARHQEENAW